MKHDVNPNFLRAKRRGQIAVEPKPNELQIDIDSPRELRRYGIIYAILYRYGIARGWREKILPSRTRGHVHIIITMKKPLPLCERIGLQAILRSDGSREAFNFARAKGKSKYPAVLFRPEREIMRPGMNFREETIWLAAILEGEGCFTLNGKSSHSPSIHLCTTDEDVIIHASHIMQTNRSCRKPTTKNGIHRKSTYWTWAHGNKAVEIMKRILPFMGERRSARINELLTRAKQGLSRRECGLLAHPKLHTKP